MERRRGAPFLSRKKKNKIMNGFNRKRFGGVLAALAIMAAVVSVRADQGWQDFGCTNTVRSNTTVSVVAALNTSTNGIAVTEQDQVAVQLMGTGDAAGSSGTITLTFQRSVDGTNWETHPKFTFLATMTGTTQLIEYTNFPSTIIGPCKALRISSVQSGDTSANLTNFFVLLGKKNLKRAP
jgi:hypothetical protein